MHRLFGDPKAHEIKRVSNREEDEPVGRGGVETTRGLHVAERTPLISPSTCIPLDPLLTTLAKEGRGDLLNWEESFS